MSQIEIVYFHCPKWVFCKFEQYSVAFVHALNDKRHTYCLKYDARGPSFVDFSLFMPWHLFFLVTFWNYQMMFV